PVALVAGSNFFSALPALIVLQTVVLMPVALFCVYGIAARIGGRLLGYLAAALWVLGPYAAIPLWDHRYHPKYVEQFLPQAPALAALALWKLKGLGHLPFLTPAPKALAAGAGAFGAGDLPLGLVVNRYFHFDWWRMHRNYLELREFFWSTRLLQWLPLAGFLA